MSWCRSCTGQRGNPIVLDRVALARILDSGTNLGCRHLIERQPELVHVHETANTRFVTDLDTVDDVRQLAERTGWRLELPAVEAARTGVVTVVFLHCVGPASVAQQEFWRSTR